ncbi:hypothetical protein Strvi_5597 [Streptomyces violaceusniger Tu 4113]|uniref:Insertion element IS150 protein InsJ-like helix-turn-helix domain-containing protein n=1 Tax=Streptomyces violaceusniger (strain Tu 4113) TaxID=653045 RepID=G2PFV9_STRV4|nr:hypothetical protein Strvi_5597 [Streptomyces violaceusniger Tu 4113]
MIHRNAPLTPTGRLRLARCTVDDRWPLRRAAERFQVSHTTAARWAHRYRQHGAAGLHDRSSRPTTHHAVHTRPTLILAWAGDPGHPVSVSETLAATIPGSTLHVSETRADLRTWGERAADFLK